MTLGRQSWKDAEAQRDPEALERDTATRVVVAVHGDDRGTAERAARRGGLVPEDRARTDAPLALRARYDGVLDWLWDRGLLGSGKEGRRRHAAGMWLRDLHCIIHRERMISNYDGLGRDQSEMSDAQAWNFKCYQETLRAMGRQAVVLLQVCADDRPPRNILLLRQALDALARHRGM